MWDSHVKLSGMLIPVKDKENGMDTEPVAPSTESVEAKPAAKNEVPAPKPTYERPVLRRHGGFESTTHQTIIPP
jgi:hypothetical protein